jgi:hypothetical protein
MQAEVRSIEANDIPGWPEWHSPTPDTDLRWFTTAVGLAGRPGNDLFQVAVATPKGIQERQDRRTFVGLVVERFEASAVEETIRRYVADVVAPTWEAIVEQLQSKMRWAYQGRQRA